MVCRVKACGALTLAGTPCKLCVAKGDKYCHLHSARDKGPPKASATEDRPGRMVRSPRPTTSQASKMVDDPAARSRPPKASVTKGRPGRTMRSPRPSKSHAAKMVDDPAVRSRPPKASVTKDRPGRAVRHAAGVAALAPVADDDSVARQLSFRGGRRARKSWPHA